MMENHDKNCLVEYYVSGVCILLVSVMGVSANILSSIVLKTRQIDTNQTLRNLLVWLAMVDSVFLVMLVMVFSLPHFSSYYRDFLFPYIVPSVLPCTSGAMTGSLYLVISLCVERVLAMPRIALNNKGALLGYVLPVSAFSIIYNLPKFFAFSTQLLEDEK